MFVLSPVYAILINKVGIKPIISIGTLGYVVWSAGLYQNSKDGTQWLVMFGAATCGISAAGFWTAEGAVAALYPLDHQRGLFVGTWMLLNKIGGLIAGAVTLSLNINNNEAGSISLDTYIALLSIQCLGLPLSFLLSPPEKLYRKDGSILKSNITQETWRQRVNTLFRVLKKKEVLCLVPLMISNVWILTWQGNFATHRFSVRVRALNSLLSALIPALVDVVAGYMLDLNFRKSLKVQVSWAVIVILNTGFYIWAFIIQSYFDKNPESGIDWTGSSNFNRAFIPMQVFKIPQELVFNWLYWVVGAYHFTSSEIPQVTGWIRCFESLGQCMAFVVGTVDSSDMTNLAVSAAVFFASVPTVTYLTAITDDEINTKTIVTDSEDEGEIAGDTVDESISKKSETNVEIRDV